MVKTLLIVLAVGLLILTGQALFHRLVDDPRVILTDERTQGAALGAEMGARQAGLDFSRRIASRPDNPPDQVGIFLRDKSEAFREAFNRAYAESYRRKYENVRLARPTQP